MKSESDEPLLTQEETARLLNTKPETLAVWRCTKRYNLPFLKIGRNVRYRRSDIERFKLQCLVNFDSTGDVA